MTNYNVMPTRSKRQEFVSDKLMGCQAIYSMLINVVKSAIKLAYC